MHAEYALIKFKIKGKATYSIHVYAEVHVVQFIQFV